MAGRGGCGGDCGDGDCGELGRRSFMKVAGAGLMSLAARPVLGTAGATQAAGPEAAGHHLIPADKRLPRGWLSGLTQRGDRRVCRGSELESIGMPIGGVAAGQMYLRGDGTLGCWQIFNEDYFSGYGRDNYRLRVPPSAVDQGFAVVADSDPSRPVRALNRIDFEDVEFVGEHPIGVVNYRDADSPLAVHLEAFSPFIPLNAEDSALPAVLFHLTLENVSKGPIRASLLAWLENAVCFHHGGEVAGQRTIRVAREAQRTTILHGAQPAPVDEAGRPPIVLADFEGEDYGTWTVEGEALGRAPAGGTLPQQQPVSGHLGRGLVNTYLGGDDRRGTLTSPPFAIERNYVNFLIGGGAHAGETCIDLVVDGQVARSATGRNQERLLWHAWDVRELAGRSARIRIVDARSGGWGHVNVDQIELSDTPRRGLSGPLEKLPDFGTMALAHAGAAQPYLDTRMVSGWIRPRLPDPGDVESQTYPISERRSMVMLTEPVGLDPGDKHEFIFVLAWHFPNREHGQRYATRFADAAAVAGYVLDNHERLTNLTRRWHETFYGGTLPRWFLERVHATVANLATGTCQWWADGRFWAWEGVGCCHGTCTHVWNYAQALARLFPALERSVREMQDLGAAFHESGLVGFRGEHNNAYAADGQAGTVLKCYREHLMSGDDAFLRRNWPRIRQVLLYSIAQDANDDGLIENAQHNTFDIDFHGANTFVGSLYLAALRAGEEMARLMGEEDLARRLSRIFESGQRLSVERLFNGEYFIQQVDLKEHAKDQYAGGCLSDQLFGEAWARQVGLGDIYPPEHVQAALRAIWKYNWAPDVAAHNQAHPPERWFAVPGEAGLFTCTWPKSEHLVEGVRYREEVWTGTEYQVAAHMAWEGMVTEALAIVRAIHDRYHPLKRNPYNEVECGDHYARALASWGVLLGLCGFEYDGPRGHLGFAPRLPLMRWEHEEYVPEEFQAPFTAAEGWGTISQRRTGIRGTDQRQRIEVRFGRLRLATLAFEIRPRNRRPSVTVTVSGRRLRASEEVRGTRLLVALAEPVTLVEGDVLEVTIS